VQQGKKFGGRREIPGVAPEIDVGDGQQGGETGFRGAHGLVGQRDHLKHSDCRQQHDEERRDDPAQAAFVEAQERELVRLHLAKNDRGNQVAADDEEDIDPDEPARHPGCPGVEQYHRHHGQSTQTVDVRAVGQGSHGDQP
jgi:hypothetical protein